MKNEGIEKASSLAITLLNLSNYSFSYKDFNSISIPNANLSKGIFHYTNFEGANLENVDFS